MSNVRNDVMEFQPISELAEAVEMSETWVRKLSARDNKSGGWAFERREVRANEREEWPAPIQYVYRATDMPVAFGRGEQAQQVLEDALKKAERRIVGLESQVASSAKRVETLTEERDSAQDRAKRLQSQVTELTNKANQAEEVADALESKAREMEQDYIDLERMFGDLFERHQSLLENQPNDLLMQMTEEIELFSLDVDFDMSEDQKDALISLMRLAMQARRNYSQVRQLTATVDEQDDPEASHGVTSVQQGSSTLADFVDSQAIAE